jgi:hypothetical protein
MPVFFDECSSAFIAYVISCARSRSFAFRKAANLRAVELNPDPYKIGASYHCMVIDANVCAIIEFYASINFIRDSSVHLSYRLINQFTTLFS